MEHLRDLDRIFTVIVAIGLLFPDAYGEAAKRIKLPLSGRRARITGTVHGTNDYREFIFQGIRGTRVKIELSGVGPVRGVITFPSGAREGAPGGVILRPAFRGDGAVSLDGLREYDGRSLGWSLQDPDLSCPMIFIASPEPLSKVTNGCCHSEFKTRRGGTGDRSAIPAASSLF